MCISDQGVKKNHKTQGLLYPEVRPPAWITPPQIPWKPHGLETSHELNSRQLQESYGNSVHWSAKNHSEAALSGSPPVACSSSFWICLNPLYQVVASCCSTFFAREPRILCSTCQNERNAISSHRPRDRYLVLHSRFCSVPDPLLHS